MTHRDNILTSFTHIFFIYSREPGTLSLTPPFFSRAPALTFKQENWLEESGLEPYYQEKYR